MFLLIARIKLIYVIRMFWHCKVHNYSLKFHICNSLYIIKAKSECYPNSHTYLHICATVCTTHVVRVSNVVVPPRRDEAIQRETEKSEKIKTVETATGSSLRTNQRSP